MKCVPLRLSHLLSPRIGSRDPPLETELSSGDRILCGPADNPSVLEFLMLPKEER